MSLCPSSLSFSEVHSAKRVEAASKTLGETVVRRLVAFALFLMGAKREEIAQHLSIPVGTLYSLLTRITQVGLPGIEDRRRSHSEFLAPVQQEAPALEVTKTESAIVLDFGGENRVVSIPAANALQAKVVLLTLEQSGVLERTRVADLLGYCAAHVGRMARQMAEGDVPAVLDKRQGQKEDYRITPEVKAELVQQFAVDVIVRDKTSGDAIAAELQERCGIVVPARTVRHHLAKMGLSAIRHTLPQLVAALKKTSGRSSNA